MGWYISWEDFISYVNGFMEVSDEIGDGWTWEGNKNAVGGAYIMKKVKQKIPNSDNWFTCKTQHNLEDSSVENEEYSAEVSLKTEKELSWEYHVVYNLSYGSPVLYFNVFTPDGRLVSLDILWESFIGGTHENIKLQRWETLSQQEHPILRRPFFQLHPCKTAEFLGHHQRASSNPVVTWISSIGPAVNILLPNAYSRLVKLNKTEAEIQN